MKLRVVYCAECGMELEVRRKAVPSEQKIYEVIRPHSCIDKLDTLTTFEEEVKKEEKKPLAPKLGALFDSFKFVQKLNKLSTAPPPMIQETGDKRDKEHLRKELLTSTAPLNLLNNIRNISPSHPENDVNVEPEGD